jgi:hypothetical protein
LFFSFDELHQPETAQTRLNIFFNLGFEVLFLWFSPFYKLRLCLEFILSTPNQLNPSGKSKISLRGPLKLTNILRFYFLVETVESKKENVFPGHTFSGLHSQPVNYSPYAPLLTDIILRSFKI